MLNSSLTRCFHTSFSSSERDFHTIPAPLTLPTGAPGFLSSSPWSCWDASLIASCDSGCDLKYMKLDGTRFGLSSLSSDTAFFSFFSFFFLDFLVVVSVTGSSVISGTDSISSEILSENGA